MDEKVAHVSVVIPVFRNADSLRELHQRLCAALEGVADAFEIIFVDDGGGDRSWEIICALAARDARVKGIEFSRNFGQHPAIAAGFAHASGDVIVLMDADLQDRPEEIPTLLRALDAHTDIAYTIKKGHVGSFFNRLTSKAFHLVFSKITGTNIPEDIGTFRAFNRNVLNALLSYPERNILFGPLMFYAGFNSVFVPLPHEKRSVGVSAYTFRKRLALAMHSLVSYTNIPHVMFLYFGLAMLSFSVLYALAVLVGYLLYGMRTGQGITLVILLLLLFMGATMTSLGIVGSYVFRVYQEVLQRPRYNIRSTINVPARRSEP